jgi:hypothetical protein
MINEKRDRVEVQDLKPILRMNGLSSFHLGFTFSYIRYALCAMLYALCFFADTRHGEPSRSSWKHSPEELKGEGNRKLSNQEKVKGLNIISKVIGLVKDKDLTP